MKAQRLGQPVQPRRKVPCHVSRQDQGDLPFDSRFIRRRHHCNAFPVIAACLSYFNHAGGEIGIAEKRTLFLRTEIVTVLFILNKGSWLNVYRREPLFVKLEIILSVHEVLVDIRIGSHQDPMRGFGDMIMEFLVQTRRAQPDDGGDLDLQVSHSKVHQSDHHGVSSILRNMCAGHIVVAGDSGKNCVGVLEARGHERRIAQVAAKDVDAFVGLDVGDLREELGFGSDVYVDVVLWILCKQLEHIFPRGARCTEH